MFEYLFIFAVINTAMIYGKLGNLESVPPRFHKYFSNLNFPSGRTELGGGAYAVVNEYETSPAPSAEQHKKFIDIHILMEGKEKIGIGFEGKISRPYEDDCTLYDAVKDELIIPFHKGMFFIFFPEDIHRPGIDFDRTQRIKKIIFKVPCPPQSF